MGQQGTGYERPLGLPFRERLLEERRFIQVLAGPRQTGKTTLVHQVLADSGLAHHYASADAPTLEQRSWIAAQWEIGRLRAREDGSAVLVLDEIQKIPSWSEYAKRLWDEDTRSGVPLQVVLLGSSPLLMRRGLSESLAGRFELTPVPHWSFPEMRDAFGYGLEQFVFFGGYPGAAGLTSDYPRWRAYVLDSLIETTISRDVMLMSRIDKPALLRQLFKLSCEYSGQILSFTKMLGQLQDAGNTTTLAHYLELLGSAGLVSGLGKYSGSQVRRRGSSPKLMVQNTGLLSAVAGMTLPEARGNGRHYCRLVESAVGSHLINASRTIGTEIFYWRDRQLEVDFVAVRSGRVTGIEVKSGPNPAARGLAEFQDRVGADRVILVGEDGLSVDDFLSTPLETLI